jgi:hypothetical protein
MTAKQLIEKLTKLRPETKIATAIDPEGNGFSLMSGDVSLCQWNDGEPEFECDQGQADAAVLWP